MMSYARPSFDVDVLLECGGKMGVCGQKARVKLVAEGIRKEGRLVWGPIRVE